MHTAIIFSRREASPQPASVLDLYFGPFSVYASYHLKHKLAAVSEMLIGSRTGYAASSCNPSHRKVGYPVFLKFFNRSIDKFFPVFFVRSSHCALLLSRYYSHIAAYSPLRLSAELRLIFLVVVFSNSRLRITRRPMCL